MCSSDLFVKDEDGNEVQLSHGVYMRLVESKNREVRRGAYEALYATYEQYQHTYAKTLQTNDARTAGWLGTAAILPQYQTAVKLHGVFPSCRG